MLERVLRSQEQFKQTIPYLEERNLALALNQLQVLLCEYLTNDNTYDGEVVKEMEQTLATSAQTVQSLKTKL